MSETCKPIIYQLMVRSFQWLVRPEWSFGEGDDQSEFFVRSNSFFYLPGRALVLPRPTWHPDGVTLSHSFGLEDGTPGHAAKVTGNNIADAAPTSTPGMKPSS